MTLPSHVVDDFIPEKICRMKNIHGNLFPHLPFKSFQFCLVYIIENNCGFTGLRCPARASTAIGLSRHDVSARVFNKVYLTPQLWNDVCGVICFILLLLAILKTTLWLSITCQLTLLSLNKMAAVSPTTSFKCTFLNKKCGIFIQVSSKFVAKGPIDNTSVLVRVMALQWTGDKSLPEPMLTISPSHICGIMEKGVKTGSRVPLGWYIRVCLHVWVSKCRCMRLCSIPMLYD